MKKINGPGLGKPIILAVFMLVLTILRPSSFLTVGNLSNVLWSISVYGIMVCGTIFVFLIGGIDLSIGSLCGLCAVTIVKVIRYFDYSNTGVIGWAGTWCDYYKVPGSCLFDYLCHTDHLFGPVYDSDKQ